MIRSRLGLKALVLSGLVLGLMAFATSAAQAEEKAKWLVAAKDVGTLAPQLVIQLIENDRAALLFTTKGGTHVEIPCTAAEFVEGGKLLGEGTISLGRVLFKGCTKTLVLLNGKPATGCHPHSITKADESGEILSEKGKGLIVLDKVSLPEKEGKVEVHTYELVKITPEKENIKKETEPSKLFAIIQMGELCAIGEEVNVESTELGEGLWIKDGGGNAGALAETVTHLILEGLNKLLALGQPAKIVGSAVIELGTPHNGLKWSGVPG